jgi:hypothetical protein
MAISKDDCTLLFYAKTLGISFKETLTLGRMNLYASRADIMHSIEKYKTNSKSIDEVVFNGDGYAESFFAILGAEKIDSIDFSAYEKATIIHDMNQPIPDNLRNNYSVVVDGGTIEHVFNFPVAIKNCMNAVKTGGYYIGITPANNQMGHGFYQFSPELYFRVFSEENGFRIKKMLINITNGTHTRWYEVSDPKAVQHRVSLLNNLPVFLMVIAEKIADKAIFEATPQQSDYTNIWSVQQSLAENKAGEHESRSKFLYRKFVPRRIKIILRNLYDIIFTEKAKDEFIGDFNPKHFKRIEL